MGVDGVLGNSGKSVGNVVESRDDTVGIIVEKDVVTRDTGIIRFIVSGSTVKFVPVVVVTVVHMCVGLANGLVGCFLVFRFQQWIVGFNYLVFCMRIEYITPEAPIAVELFVPAHLQFVTTGLHFTQVGGRCGSTIIGGYRTTVTIEQDVGSVFLEEVDRSGDYTTEQCIVGRDVQFCSYFPMYVGVTHLRLIVPLIGALCRIDSCQSLVESTTVAPGVHVEPASANVVIP